MTQILRVANEARILRLTQVKERTGLSRSTLYSLMREGKFPAPIPIGARAVGWLSSDIDAWIRALVATRTPANRRQQANAEAQSISFQIHPFCKQQ